MRVSRLVPVVHCPPVCFRVQRPSTGRGTVVQHIPLGGGAVSLQKLGHLWISRDFAGSDMIANHMGGLSYHGGVVAKIEKEFVVGGVVVVLTVTRLLVSEWKRVHQKL